MIGILQPDFGFRAGQMAEVCISTECCFLSLSLSFFFFVAESMKPPLGERCHLLARLSSLPEISRAEDEEVQRGFFSYGVNQIRRRFIFIQGSG